MALYPVHRDPRMRLRNTGFEAIELGNSIALDGSFSDPFTPRATGPSAHEAPGYPAIVAVIINFFGVGPEGDFALHWLTRLALAAELALLPFLAEYWGLHAITGALAAALWLLAHIPLLPGEGYFAGMLIVALAFPMYRAFDKRLSTAAIIVVGIVWGLLLLLTPTPMLVLILWLIGLARFSPQSRRQIALLAIIPLLIISPWLVRNYLVFHRPVFMRDNLGLELAVSNNDCAQFSFALNRVPDGCFAKSHPNESDAEARRVAAMGEVAYNQLRLHQALNWIDHNRSRFLHLAALRFIAFWFPNATGNPFRPGPTPRDEVLTGVFTVLSIPGLLLLWSKNRVAFGLLCLWLVCFPLVYYLVQFEGRYRYPILWATFLPASYVVTVLFSVPRKTRGRVAVADG